MQVTPTDIPGVVIVEPKVFRDARGFFLESYHEQKYRQAGIDIVFVQDNHSLSARHTLRGLHLQKQYPQGKLIRVLEGEIFDVAVEVRKGSPHFGKWVGVMLSAENHKQLYVPPGMAHGFCVVSERAQVEYKCTDFYHPEDELTIQWDDAQIGVDWPTDKPILSNKDQNGLTLEAAMDQLPKFEGVAA